EDSVGTGGGAHGAVRPQDHRPGQIDPDEPARPVGTRRLCPVADQRDEPGEEDRGRGAGAHHGQRPVGRSLMTTTLRIAFLPLTDAAVLAVARERGFAEEEGIALDLVRTTSWATLRDRLVFGQVQAAQMLAPLAVAVTLGLSQQPAALAAPYKLNVNGNMLVMASDFAKALEPDVAARLADPLGTAHDFAAAIGLWKR